MHPLEQHSVVLIGRHRYSRVAHPTVGRAAICVRPRRPLAGADDYDIAVFTHADAFDARKRRRIDALKLTAQLFNGPLSNLLPDHASIILHTEQNLPAALVQEGANRHSRFATRTSSLLELQRLRLAGRNEG